MSQEAITAPLSRNQTAKHVVKSFSLDRRVYEAFRERVKGENASRVIEFLILHYLGIPHPLAERMRDIPTEVPRDFT